MRPFQLYQCYSADQIATAIRGVRDGHFVVGAGRAACLARLRSPEPPSFPERGEFFWPRSCPDAVLARGVELHLFAKRGTDGFLYVGRAGARSYGSGCSGRRFEARFDFEPRLPRALWLELQGWSAVEAPKGEPAESEIVRLTPASSTAQRMRALEVFLERWHGHSKARKPLKRKRLAMPRPLAEFYELARGRHAVVFNSLPRIPEPTDGRLVFCVENQGVYLWSTEAKGNDPAVWGRFDEPGMSWRREKERLSGFLIELGVFEAIYGAPCGATAAHLESAAVRRLCSRMTRLPLGAWRWPAYPSRFYARKGALAFISPNGNECSVYVGAKHPAVLDFMADLIDDAWQVVRF